MWTYEHFDELQHYGVIGMRWGIHRARKNGSAYTYKSKAQKKWESRLNDKSISDKSREKARSKYEMYKKRDANRQSYVEQTNVGKSVIKGLLLSPFGAGSYHRLRSAGMSKTASFLISGFAPLPVAMIASKIVENEKARRE